MHIVHMQCSLRVDGGILAGVFLTFSFCVVPESSYSSNTVISLQIALLQLVAPSQWWLHSKTNGDSHRNWWLFSSRSSLCAKPPKTHVLLLGFYEALLGLLI